eukprot:gnl/MRDRNA2_/MRDRNA2_132973_c0_seq1.p1 gnl/MRDRNA2_/MRDRNA2_132973_c0~~gnl/MRDRNA2_/MRDRNA2_132973_c0_seq1.p1  ORF type:complete len:520 (+),score=95.34 gnl/MRDRNA2_/MRDRNA2_132973_c0_seq1:85-1644(+)
MGAVCSSGIGCHCCRDKNEPELPSAAANGQHRVIDRLDSIGVRTSGRSDGHGQSPELDGEHFGHSFASMNTHRIDEVYDVDFLQRTLGEGAFGTVRIGRHRAIGVQRAVKSISRSVLKGKTLKAFETEMSIMKALDHPNIVKLYETFQDAKFVYLVMELCLGGELFDKIVEDGPTGFSERQAATYVEQILAAVVYLHKLGIAHRDLKPENFLMQDKSEDAEVKLIDFGISRWYHGKPMKTRVGTAYYMSPEAVYGRYDLKCDIWSCGVLAYVLLCGYTPFDGATDNAILMNVQKQKLEFPVEEWDHISEGAKDLVTKMLIKDPKLRPNAQEMLQHHWLTSCSTTPRVAVRASTIVSHFQAFSQAQKFKRVCLTLIATQLKDQDIAQLRQQFRSLDQDGDGSISHKELLNCVDSLGLGKEEVDELMSIDSDGSGLIDYTEFLAALIDRQTYQRRDVAWAAFRTFDLDGDGVITLQELQQVMNQGDSLLCTAKVQSLISEVDENADGVIDFEEFMAMLEKE